MDGHGHGISKPDELAHGYALTGKVMLTSVIAFFLVVLILICFHLYSRCFLGRHTPRRLLFSTRFSLPARGLDAAAIAALPTFVYAANASAKTPECAVCLSEFEERESGRVLPKCGHRFHVECIDTWLRSRSSCPVCRAPVRPEPPVDVCGGTGSGSSDSSFPLPPPGECRRKPPEIVVELAGGNADRSEPVGVSGSNSRVEPDLSLKRFVSI